MNDRIDDLKSAIAAHVLKRAEDGTIIIQSEQTGTRAPWLFDFRAIVLQGKWLDAIAELFWQRNAHRYPFQVGGMETVGIALVAAIVMKGMERGTPVNGFFIRKSRKRDGLMKYIEGTLTDEPIILVDDLIHSGRTFEKEIAVLEEAQKKIVALFTVLAYRDLHEYAFATAKGIALDTLYTLDEFNLKAPAYQPTIEPREHFEIVWRFKSPNPSYHTVVAKSAPCIDGGRIFFGTDDGIFLALDASTGLKSWQFNVQKHPKGKGILSSPAVHNDTVYFGAYDGNVYALDAHTGGPRWIYADADWIGSSPAIAQDIGALFIGLEFGLFRKKGGLAALSLETGTLLWEQKMPEYVHASPLYVREENLVAVGCNDGILYAFDARTGEPRWKFKTQGDIKSASAYDAKRRLIAINSMDGVCYVISVVRGELVFTVESGAPIYSSPCIGGDSLFIASLDKSIYAIDLDSGKRRWAYETRGRIFSTPRAENDSLWIGSNDGCLYELDRATGKEKGRFQATERIVNNVAIDTSAGLLYLPLYTNELLCLRKI